MRATKIAHLLTLRDRVKFAKQLCFPGEFNGHVGRECELNFVDRYKLSIGKDVFVDPAAACCPIEQHVLEVGIVLPDWYAVSLMDENTTAVSIYKQWYPADLEVLISKLTADGYRVDITCDKLPEMLHLYVTRSN